MSTYAQQVLTELGFKRISYPEFLDIHQRQAREIFGEDVNLGDESPLGQWIKFISFMRAEDNELAEAVFLAGNVDNATGISLDYAVSKFGVSRFAEEKSTGVRSLKVLLTPGATLEAGFIVETLGGVQFRTITNVTDTDNDGVVYADVEAVEFGARGNINTGTSITIQTPVPGVTGASIVANITGGRNREVDKELRAKYYKSISSAGGSTTDSVLAAILDIPEVRAARVTENDTDIDKTATGGLPRNSIGPVVLGGRAEEIGRAILSKKAGGIRSYGTHSVEVQDASGNFQSIGFSYATGVHIYVKVKLSTNAAFPDNGASLVEQEIIQYIGGVDANGTNYLGLGMAESVIYAQVIRAITVPGIDDLTVEIRRGDTGPYTTANILIGAVEVAETNAGRVDVIID